MAEQSLDMQVERRRLEIRRNRFVNEFKVGDILVQNTRAELVTGYEGSTVNVLGRLNTQEGIYSARIELINHQLTLLLNEEFYSKNDSDDFRRKCYEAGDQMLKEAGI